MSMPAASPALNMVNTVNTINTINTVNPESSEDPRFDDIRPCRDDEVRQALEQVMADKAVISGILRFRYPFLARHFSFVLVPLVRQILRRRVANIHTIADFQRRVADFVEHMLETTTDGAEFVGFDRLKPGRGYLFISNHRDISLDPALIDIALYRAGLDTVRIAIGDNLLRTPAASSLMRLNKSFIVKRSVIAPRDRLKVFNELSDYIGLSIAEGHSVWIAEREGRAKDGDDRTEEALLKMLGLRGRRLKVDFASYIASLNLVPVSITYEYDPNDLSKARELEERERHQGEYHKEALEDLDTIAAGIRGYKGRVRLVAGEPLISGFTNSAELAALIDRFIWENYAIYPSALLSAGESAGVDEAARLKFAARLESYPAGLRERVRAMYAKPLKNRREAGIQG